MKNRQPKRKLALRTMTPLEKKMGISPFFSRAWIARADARRKLEIKRNKNVKTS